MPIAGRSARWAMPVLACIVDRSKIATPVVSLPVPAVVGMAISGLSGPGTGLRLADRRVDVVEESAGIGRVEIGGLGGVDTEPPPTATKPSNFALGGELDRLRERGIGRLDADLVEQDDIDTGAALGCRARVALASRLGAGIG